MYKEGFQPKDPISIHQRIAKEKNDVSSKLKVPVITGVLESPEILSSLQISKVGSAEEGGPMETQAASMKAPEIIPTPMELSPSSSDAKAPLMANPPLQNGPDTTGVATALATKGSTLMTGTPSSEVQAVTANVRAGLNLNPL
jgi:hypothetical protein